MKRETSKLDPEIGFVMANSVVDEVMGHGKDHGELSYWTDHYHCFGQDPMKNLGKVR